MLRPLVALQEVVNGLLVELVVEVFHYWLLLDLLVFL
jgi:hypothetical protein